MVDLVSDIHPATTAPADSDHGSTDVLGLHVSAINLDSAVSTIERWIDSPEPERRYVCVCTVHTIMECQRDPELLSAVNSADLRTPDGMPLVWLSRRAGHHQVSRVYGPDLVMALCGRSATTGHRHYFYGGAPGVAETMVNRLVTRYPELQVAGTHSPPIAPVGTLEDQATIQRINDSRADIVWVGLGNPKQEWWMVNHRPLLNAPVLIGVGAAFDFHAGRVRQAPKWMQRSGLEWLFRLSQDPKRLWRRYIFDNSRFLVRLARSALFSR